MSRPIFETAEGEPDFDMALDVLQSPITPNLDAGKALETLRQFRSLAEVCFACLRPEQECSGDPCSTVIAQRKAKS